MIYGIGLDVLRVKRIEAVYRRHGERFVERLLHPLERKEFEQAARPAQYLLRLPDGLHFARRVPVPGPDLSDLDSPWLGNRCRLLPE